MALTNNDIQQVLTTNTSSISGMSYSPVPSLNKRFITTDKRAVGAVNETFSGVKQIESSLASFTAFYNSLIGDANLDPSLKTNLEKIDQNIILAILKLWMQVNGSDLDHPNIVNNLSSVVQDLSGQLGNISTPTTTFISLQDTPNTYAGFDGSVVAVSGANLQFVPKEEITKPKHGTTVERAQLTLTLAESDTGYRFYDTSDEQLYTWIKNRWVLPTITVGTRSIVDYYGTSSEILPLNYHAGDRWTDTGSNYVLRICKATIITNTIADWISVGRQN